MNWEKEGCCQWELLASHPWQGIGALDIARKKTFLVLWKKTVTVETPTKPSSVWTVVVCMAGKALGTRTFEIYSSHCCRFWQIVLPAIVFPEQFEISWVYSFMSIGVQELLSSGEDKYKNPEARLQREMSLQKKHHAGKGVCLVCLIFLLLSGILGFLLQGLHQDDKLESFQNGNTIP